MLSRWLSLTSSSPGRHCTLPSRSVGRKADRRFTGYREAVRRLRAIAQEADAGRTASLLALFRGLPALLPSLSQAGVDFAAAARAGAAEAAGPGPRGAGKGGRAPGPRARPEKGPP